MTVWEDAQILWDYHQMHHEPRKTDIAIGLGSHDIGVAEHTADLYHQGCFPLIVFTGSNAPTTVDVFPRGEAVHYAERAKQLGVPGTAIIIEPKAENTGENFTLTRTLLEREGIHPSSATVISRPYQQRRAYATCRKLWPQLDVICSSRPQTLDAYVKSIGDLDKVLNMLVGDTQRIWVYAEAGHAIPQRVPGDVLAAYRALVKRGFNKRLVNEAHAQGGTPPTEGHQGPETPLRPPLSDLNDTLESQHRARSQRSSPGSNADAGTLGEQGMARAGSEKRGHPMSVATTSNSLYRNVAVGELAETMLTIFECTGIERNGATYISTPITTGERLIRWHEDRNESITHEQLRAEVIELNMATVQPLIEKVRKTLPHQPLVEPAGMADVPGWSQPEYHSFWCAFIERYANTVVFNEGWQLSNGCAAEFATAVLAGHTLLDHELAPLSTSQGVELIETSLVRLEAAGLDTTLLRRAAEAVRAG